MYTCFRDLPTHYPGFPYTMHDVIAGLPGHRAQFSLPDCGQQPGGALLWTHNSAHCSQETAKSVEDILRELRVCANDPFTDKLAVWKLICAEIGPIVLVTGVRQQPLVTLIQQDQLSDDILNVASPTVFVCQGVDRWTRLRVHKVPSEQKPNVQHTKPNVIGSAPMKCRCGQNIKRGAHCTPSASYKSRCPCLRAGRACTYRCRCHGCANECGRRTGSSAAPSSSRAPKLQTARGSASPAKECTAVHYDQNDTTKGSWMSTELFLLFMCAQAQSCRSTSIPLMRTHQLYAAAVTCQECLRLWQESVGIKPRPKSMESVRCKIKQLIPCHDWSDLKKWTSHPQWRCRSSVTCVQSSLTTWGLRY